jgi:hypothetical protein
MVREGSLNHTFTVQCGQGLLDPFPTAIDGAAQKLTSVVIGQGPWFASVAGLARQ